MRRPYKRYLYGLSHKLGIDIDVISSWSVRKIAEYMAYDLTLSDEWRKKAKAESEKDRQAEMTEEERAEMFKRVLGGSS